MQTNFQSLIETLSSHQVRYIIVGGVALVLQGSSRITQDLDICYARDEENLKALSSALSPSHAYLRGAPPGLPFQVDAETLRSGLNFTLVTDFGDIDLLGEVSGVGKYEDFQADAVPMKLYNHTVLVMGLGSLEKAKRAAGRLKDLLDLEEIMEIRKRTESNN